MVFDRPLLTPDGSLLLQADQELTPEVCALLRAGPFEVFAPAAAAPPMHMPEPGFEDSSGDDTDGAPISPPRRILWERQRLAALSRGELRRSADALVASKKDRWSRLPLRVLALADATPGPMSMIANSPALGAIELLTRAELWTAVITRALDDAPESPTTDPAPIIDLADELADLARRRPAALLLDALNTHEPGSDNLQPGAPEHLALNALRVAGLAALAAARLGWSDIDIRDAALTALLADAGMLLLPPTIASAPRPLVDEEFNQVRRHPAFSVAIMNRLRAADRARGIPERVELAVYQHHERDNARGYPDLIPARGLHDLAKLIGACDVLVSLTSARAHRPALDPAAAVRELVHSAARAELNGRSVRAIVDVCGVYPPGSRVRLSSGHAGQVVAKGPGDGLRPVVKILTPRSSDTQPTINLAESTHVRVLGPMAA